MASHFQNRLNSVLAIFSILSQRCAPINVYANRQSNLAQNCRFHCNWRCTKSYNFKEHVCPLFSSINKRKFIAIQFLCRGIVSPGHLRPVVNICMIDLTQDERSAQKMKIITPVIFILFYFSSQLECDYDV